MAGVESGGAATCKRCGASVAVNSVCPKCGLPSNAAFSNLAPTKPLVPPPPPPPGRPAHAAPRATGAVPPPPRPASAVPPKPKTLPATPPAARPVSNKVACALCMQSMPRESAVAVDDAVAPSLGALSAPYRGKTLCPTCLETLRAKAARAPAPSGEIPDLVAPAKPSAPASPSGSAVAAAEAAASSRPASGGAQPMPPHFWVAGGLAGALVGSAIYLGLHYGLDFRWAPVIILVGGLIGIGVRLGAQASTGLGPGAVAAVLTILTGFTTSYIIASGEAAQWRAEAEAEMQNHLVGQIAYEIAKAKQDRGEDLGPIPIEEDEDAEDTTENMYPRDVWREANTTWDGLADDEKERRRREYQGDTAEFESSMTVWGMIFEFSALFWFCIAAGTAYKAGAGS